MKLIFFEDDKHQIFFQIDTIIYVARHAQIPKKITTLLFVLKTVSLQCLYNISKKKLGMEFIFCIQINIKVSTSWHYHFDESGQIFLLLFIEL